MRLWIRALKNFIVLRLRFRNLTYLQIQCFHAVEQATTLLVGEYDPLLTKNKLHQFMKKLYASKSKPR